MKKPYSGYHIARGYASLLLYRFAGRGSRISSTRVQLSRRLARWYRYQAIGERLIAEGLPVPPYGATEALRHG